MKNMDSRAEAGALARRPDRIPCRRYGRRLCRSSSVGSFSYLAWNSPCCVPCIRMQSQVVNTAFKWPFMQSGAGSAALCLKGADRRAAERTGSRRILKRPFAIVCRCDGFIATGPMLSRGAGRLHASGLLRAACRNNQADVSQSATKNIGNITASMPQPANSAITATDA